MKNKNNSNAALLMLLVVFFLLGNSQWLAAQDPLVIENDTVKVNGALEVNGSAILTGDLNAEGGATLTGDIKANNAFIGNIKEQGNTYAGFSHKDAIGLGTYGFLHDNTGQSTLINKAPGEAGFIGFRVNNVDKMVILNNGNVGIGTENPGEYKLNVNGSLNVNDNLNVNGTLNVKDGNLNLDNGNITLNNKTPIVVKRFEPKTTTGYLDTGYSTNDWNASIGGFDTGYGDIDEQGRKHIMYLYLEEVDNQWRIYFGFATHEGNHENWPIIDVTFFRKEISRREGF